tara:strand:+ start:1986 stop:2435 length:450 start_codon:yes stop_codon:yes gene_type:complete
MILDERSEFCDATALDTAGTGRDLVGDVMDLGPTARDMGAGQPMYLVLSVDTSVTSGGSATVEFELCSDAQAAIAADGTATIHASTGAIAKATLVAGYETIIALPVGNTYERFLGIVANVGAAALTAGKINAFLTMDHKAHRSYPDATN